MEPSNEVKTCKLPHCNNEVQGNRLTCSSTCARLWATTYRYSDPEHAARHRIQQAKSIARNPEKYSEVRRRWAAKVLAQAEGITS